MVRPVRDTLIAVLICLIGAVAMILGRRRLQIIPEDVAGIATMVIGGIILVMGCLFAVNFLRALRIMRAIRRGDGLVARWQVPAETIQAFRTAELARPRGTQGRWLPSARELAEGVEITVAGDGVLVGQAYHGLASTGLNRLAAVQAIAGNPITLEFQNLEAAINQLGGFTTLASQLRLPVARMNQPEATLVLRHFSEVLDGKLLAEPDLWQWRIRIGLMAALISVAIALAGWALASHSGGRTDTTEGLVATILMIAGSILALGGLVLALVAAAFQRQQRRQR